MLKSVLPFNLIQTFSWNQNLKRTFPDSEDCDVSPRMCARLLHTYSEKRTSKLSRRWKLFIQPEDPVHSAWGSESQSQALRSIVEVVVYFYQNSMVYIDQPRVRLLASLACQAGRTTGDDGDDVNDMISTLRKWWKSKETLIGGGSYAVNKRNTIIVSTYLLSFGGFNW